MNPRSLFYVEKWPGVDFRWGSLFVVTPASGPRPKKQLQSPAGDTGKAARNNTARRRTQKPRARTRAKRPNRTPNIRTRGDPPAVENDISNRFHAPTTNKRRAKTPETLWNPRGDPAISDDAGNTKQVQTLINELNFDKLCFRRKRRYTRKEFIKRKSHNHFEFKSIWMS